MRAPIRSGIKRITITALIPDARHGLWLALMEGEWSPRVAIRILAIQVFFFFVMNNRREPGFLGAGKC